MPFSHAQPGFLLGVSPDWFHINPGQRVEFRVDVRAYGGFTATVKLSARIIPANNVVVLLDKASGVPSLTSVLSVITTNDTPIDVYRVNITAQARNFPTQISIRELTVTSPDTWMVRSFESRMRSDTIKVNDLRIGQIVRLYDFAHRLVVQEQASNFSLGLKLPTSTSTFKYFTLTDTSGSTKYATSREQDFFGSINGGDVYSAKPSPGGSASWKYPDEPRFKATIYDVNVLVGSLGITSNGSNHVVWFEIDVRADENFLKQWNVTLPPAEPGIPQRRFRAAPNQTFFPTIQFVSSRDVKEDTFLVPVSVSVESSYYPPGYAAPKEKVIANFDVTIDVSKTRSLLAMKLSATEVKFGQSVNIVGTLESIKRTPIANAQVAIRSRSKGTEWKEIGKVDTDRQGRFSYDWTPPSTGQFEIEASWNGSDLFGSANDTAVLNVEKAGLLIRISISRSDPVTGASFTIRGKLDPKPLYDLPIRLEYLSGDGKWTLIEERMSSNGEFKFEPWYPVHVGAYTIRVYFIGDRNYEVAEEKREGLTVDFSLLLRIIIPAVFGLAGAAISVGAGGAKGLVGKIRRKRRKDAEKRQERHISRLAWLAHELIGMFTGIYLYVFLSLFGPHIGFIEIDSCWSSFVFGTLGGFLGPDVFRIPQKWLEESLSRKQ